MSRTTEQKTELVDAMADWVHGLSAWQIFMTGTFAFERGVSLPSSIRAFEKYRRRALRDCDVFVAHEAHPGGHGTHVHALINSGGTELRRTQLWADWKSHYGRARIEPIRSRADVEKYCSSYVVKDRDAWWDFALELDRSLFNDERGRAMRLAPARSRPLPSPTQHVER